MEVFNGTSFSSLVENNKRQFQGLLPELVKRLILNSDENVNHIRIPGNEDVWAPGFDGIVETTQSTPYVCSGLSVWEFGTNSDSLKKVNDDFNKRTEKPLGILQQNTEFYLVVPYIWAYDNQGVSLTKWESDHKATWKNVHIIDATVLAGWINSEPAVCAWLLEQVENETELNFATVTSAWEKFAAKTSPALPHSLFLEGREKKVDQFQELWGNPIIKVKADTTIDAFGFCLSVINLDAEKANKVIVIDNQTTYKALARFCKGKIFLMGFHLDCDVISGNQVVLCYNKEDHTVHPDIELHQLSKSLFDKAIKDMNIPNGQMMDLYKKTHGSLLSLIRKIPGNTTIGAPKWAKQDRIDLLAPILLLRDYDSQNECEQQLISYLAGISYDVILEKYRAWLRLEDAPIKCVENHLILINFEEAWDVLRLGPGSEIYNRMIKVIIAAISKQPSKTEMQSEVVPGQNAIYIISF